MAGKETRATALLARREVTHTVREYEHDPRSESYGAEAATALEVDTARVLKTLIVTVGGTCVVAVVPVRHQLDRKAVAAAVGGKKAAMADSASAQRVAGYVAGGISPVGLRTPLSIVLDCSALRWETVLCSAGRRGLQVELAPADLVRLTDAMVAPIARAG